MVDQLRGSVLAPERLSAAFLASRYIALQQEGALARLRVVADFLRENPPAGATEVRTHLHEVSEPTLFVWGAKDERVSVDDAQECCRRMVAAEFVVIDEAAHLPFAEDPAAVARALTEFVGGL